MKIDRNYSYKAKNAKSFHLWREEGTSLLHPPPMASKAGYVWLRHGLQVLHFLTEHPPDENPGYTPVGRVGQVTSVKTLGGWLEINTVGCLHNSQILSFMSGHLYCTYTVTHSLNTSSFCGFVLVKSGWWATKYTA